MKHGSCASVAGDYLRQRKGLFAWALFWRALYVIVPMQVPVVTGAVIDGLTGKPVSTYGILWPTLQPREILMIAMASLLAVAAAYGLSSYVRLMSAARLSQAFVADLRHRILQKTARLSLRQHQELGAAELLDRTLTDTRTMRRFLDRVYIHSTANFVRLGYPILMLVLLDWSLALIALAVLPPQWLVARHLHRRLHEAAKTRRATQSELTAAVKENLDGVETIQALDAGESCASRIMPRASHVERDELRSNKYSAMISANVWFMTGAGLAAVWWLGGTRVVEGTMTLGTLVVFTGFVTFAYQPFRQFTTIASTYREGLVSLQRIADLLAVEPDVCDGDVTRPLVVRDGHIRMRNIGLSYGDREVLTGIDLDIAPRAVTAIVGRSGSGKSSLLRLIPRLVDPDAGRLLVDGQAISDVTLRSLRSQVALVTQQPAIFGGTIVDNLRLGCANATDADIRLACASAEATEFIDALDDGLQTRIGLGGICLSGGQLQRLAIARALLTHPKILLLDEPTSALDTASESAIVATLRRLRQHMTIVLVAHRPQATRIADHLVVLEAGRVEAQGSHRVLLATSPTYQALFGTPKVTHARTA